MRATAALIAAALIAGPVAAAGQVRVVRRGDDRLVGIAEVDVVVSVAEAAEATARACPHEMPNLGSIAADALRQGGIRATVSERSSSWFYTVAVRLQGARADRQCATSVAVELIAQVRGLPDADAAAAPGAWGSLFVGEMSLIRSGALVTGPGEVHDAAVARAVREHVTAIAARLRAANP